jgi:DNA-binding CsgD family transcriptional regulator
MPWAVLHGLMQLIRCDSVSFTELDEREHVVATQQDLDDGERCLDLAVPDDADPTEGVFWSLYGSFLPCQYAYRTGDLASVIRWSDFYSRGDLAAQPLYAEYFGPGGWRHGMVASMPAALGRTRRVLLWRGPGRDFTERDRLVLQLLRPHLYDVYLDAERRRRGVPRLSRREQEVLALAARGHSNADIARMLFISVGTVRKHMEHIFDRTGARNRLAAAALGLSPLGPTEPVPRHGSPATIPTQDAPHR